MDEKSRILALDREQPVLPMAPGMSERRIVVAGARHAHIRKLA